MADELQVIAQPDSVPGPSVSTGYQQQNVIAEAMRNGFDGSAPISDTSTTIKIPIGGPVDVNGVLFSLASIATLTIPLADTDYYIYLEAGSTVDYLTPKLTTNAGTFSASKNARYTASNERILNWVVRRDASASYVYKMLDVQNVLVLSDQGLRTLNNVTFGDITGEDGTFSSVFSPLVTGNSVVSNSSLSALGISTLTGAVFANNNLSVAGDLSVSGNILPDTTPTSGSYAIAGTSSQTLSRGVYVISPSGVSGVYLEIYSGGTWYQITGGANNEGGTLFSGGTSYARIRNSTATSKTVYYLKY